MAKLSAQQKQAQAREDKRAARGAAALLSFAFDMPMEAFFRGTRGSATEAEARQILFDVLRRAIGTTSIARLGQAVGRDRTTVAHALEKIAADCEEDDALEAFIFKHAELTRELIGISSFTLSEIEEGVKAARPHA